MFSRILDRLFRLDRASDLPPAASSAMPAAATCDEQRWNDTPHNQELARITPKNRDVARIREGDMRSKEVYDDMDGKIQQLKDIQVKLAVRKARRSPK
jgi:hypothetical protein